MELTSPAFIPDGMIPSRHTGDGEDLSPPLAWTPVPGAKSYALIMDDPDAPAGTWVHWVLYDIPAKTTALAEGQPKADTLLATAKHGKCWGVDRFEDVGYRGPLPPPGRPHRYSFRLYALSGALGLKPRATKAQVVAAMEGKVLARAELVGKYGRAAAAGKESRLGAR